ncbi:hypothetical protein KC842_00520 [Candidatus Nomurabacteria bacterium]|nr:hypothetical protein [Candidatus Nomurabacteria bacterium]USN94947.1 MAG: hypothetical protein H6791_00770 [Candidatus Nomurabacteria bacterium]
MAKYTFEPKDSEKETFEEFGIPAEVVVITEYNKYDAWNLLSKRLNKKEGLIRKLFKHTLTSYS